VHPQYDGGGEKCPTAVVVEVTEIDECMNPGLHPKPRLSRSSRALSAGSTESSAPEHMHHTVAQRGTVGFSPRHLLQDAPIAPFPPATTRFQYFRSGCTPNLSPAAEALHFLIRNWPRKTNKALAWDQIQNWTPSRAPRINARHSQLPLRLPRFYAGLHNHNRGLLAHSSD
jgi:hypothetical protein